MSRASSSSTTPPRPAAVVRHRHRPGGGVRPALRTGGGDACRPLGQVTTPDANAHAVANEVSDSGARLVPVVAEQPGGDLVGVVSRGDLLATVTTFAGFDPAEATIRPRRVASPSDPVEPVDPVQLRTEGWADNRSPSPVVDEVCRLLEIEDGALDPGGAVPPGRWRPGRSVWRERSPPPTAPDAAPCPPPSSDRRCGCCPRVGSPLAEWRAVVLERVWSAVGTHGTPLPRPRRGRGVTSWSPCGSMRRIGASGALGFRWPRRPSRPRPRRGGQSGPPAPAAVPDPLVATLAPLVARLPGQSPLLPTAPADAQLALVFDVLEIPVGADALVLAPGRLAAWAAMSARVPAG